jgi:hypothetical protein
MHVRTCQFRRFVESALAARFNLAKTAQQAVVRTRTNELFQLEGLEIAPTTLGGTRHVQLTATKRDVGVLSKAQGAHGAWVSRV